MRLSGLLNAAGSKIAPWVKTKGHFEYELQRSRDTRYPANPAFKFDTYGRFFLHAYKGKLECYPLFAFIGTACALAVGCIWWSLGKQEIWLNRAHRDPPWDWARLRSSYWVNNARLWYVDGKEQYSQRLPIMETLNDEMLEAAIKKGTRNPDGSTKSSGHH